MSINMAWAALKSAVGAAPVAAAAASQVAAEQVPSTWDVLILHTPPAFQYFMVKALCKCTAVNEGLYILKFALGVIPSLLPTTHPFLSMFAILLNSTQTLFVLVYPPLTLSSSVLKSIFQVSVAVRSLATVKPHVPLIKVKSWKNCILDKYNLGIWTLCFPSSVLVLLWLLQLHSLNLWLPRYCLTNLLFFCWSMITE